MSQTKQEFEEGPGNFGAAIVEDMDNVCHLIHVPRVRFKPPPEPDWFVPKPKTVSETPNPKVTFEWDLAKEPKPHPTPEWAKVEVPRFKPRYFRISAYWHMFMVRPDVGELFQDGGYVHRASPQDVERMVAFQ